MKKAIKWEKTDLEINDSTQGETIEQKIERIVEKKEPITDNAPIIYQMRNEGVNPAYDVRTDKWEIALDAMDYVTKTDIAKREKNAEKGKIIDINKEKNGENSAGAEANISD